MAEERLVALFLTKEISATTVNGWLKAAYSGLPEGARSLYLVDSVETPRDRVQPTVPDIADIKEYPFLDRGVQWLAEWLKEKGTKSASMGPSFLVADEKSKDTDTLLFVFAADWQNLQTVRLGASQINRTPMSVELGNTDMDELRDLAGDDGVFRGSAVA